MNRSLPQFLVALGSKFKTFKNLSALAVVLLLCSGGAWGQVSNYSFSQSSGTYSAISGGTLLASSTTSTTLDEEVYTANSIGFNFVYNGVTYNTFGLNVNGWISMGSTLPVTSSTPISTGTSPNIISAISGDLYGRQFITANTTSGSPTITMTTGILLGVSVGDAVFGTGIATGSTVVSKTSTTVTLSLNASSTGTARNIRFANGKVRFETTGTAPNRVLVVQFSNFSRYTTSGGSDYMNFQIRLYETSNVINFIYDIPYVNTSVTREVGLKGDLNTNYFNRTTTTNWSSTTTGSTNASNCTLSSTVFPTSGLTFTFTPPPVCTAPTSLAASASSSAQTTTSISGSFTAAASNVPTGYIVVRSTSATQPTTLALATALPAVGSTVFGTGTYVEYVNTAAGSWTSTGLSAGTPYYYYVFSYNNTSCSGGPAYSASATTFSQSTVSCPVTILGGLSYSATPVSYCLSSAIAQNTATLATTAGNVTYTVSPALPTGLSISSSSGAITGTPTAAVAATDYTVTANNGCTSTTAIVNIATLTLPVAPVASAATNLGLTSFTANWAAASSATSYILDVSTSSTFASFVSGFNGLNVGNVTTKPITGLTSATTYYYRVRATNGTCTSSSSSAITQATPTISGGVLQETFPTANLGAVPTGWSTSVWSIGASSTSGYPGNLANAIYLNLYSSVTTGTFTTAIVGPLLANAKLTYDYALYNYNTTTATAAGWGNFQVQISTDFGTTWSNLGTAVTANTPSGYVNISQSLSAYTGQYVQFKINATWTTGDYYLSFDNFNAIGPCPTPSSPTALTQGATGPGSIAESFTPNASLPDNYMVVRYPAGSAVTAPTNGTTSYAVGQTLGLGTISNIVSGASSTFTLSGLSPATNYDVYVYPYTINNCTGGSVFGTALSGTHSTSACPAIPSTITVGATGDYTSLSAVSLILNGCAISNPVLVELQSNYNPTNETLPIVFNNNTGSSATNTVTIRPATGAGPFVLSSTSTSALLDLNGARYYTFDGRAGGTGTTAALSITNLGNGAALRLFNDAQNNTIKYVALKSSNTSATNGVVRITSAAGTTLANGNNNNTITNCSIDGSGVSPNGIYANGSTVPADNKANVISNNSIFNYYSDVAATNNYGILLSGNNAVSASSAWTISGNSFYQTASRTFTSNAGIISAIGGGYTPAGAFNITGNFIGGTSASAGGTAQTLTGAAAYIFTPISMLIGGADATTISGNTIANFNVTTASTATTVNALILAATTLAGNTVSINNNILGNSSGSISFTGGTSSVLHGITVGSYYSSQLATSFSINNNTIAGIALPGTTNANSFRGINVGTSVTATAATSITGNTIGTLLAPITNASPGAITGILNANAIGSSILNNTVSYLTSTSTSTSAQLVGISTTNGINTIGGSGTNGNTIANLTSSAANTGTTTATSVIGITQTATTAGQVVKNNKVSLLSNTGTASASVNGIYFSGPTTGTNEVSANLVHTLSSTTAASTINGIQIDDAGNASVYNNIIRLGLDSAGADATNNVIFNGINQSNVASNHGIYFNTVYISGANVGAGANNTFAITSAATSGTRAIRNNIFSNLRANAAGTGKHYSIKVSGLTGLTINNNDYWTGSTSSMLALNNATDATTLAAFQTATSQDGGSISVNPGFMTANGSASTFDLHITGGVSSALESGGATIAGIVTDYDGQARPGPVGSTNGGGAAPDMGADEFDGIPGYTCATLSGLTAVTTNATVCNNAAVLSITGTISGTGITYQWQVATTQSGTYSNISGATSSTYTVPTTTISNNWYQCVVTCLNGPVSATATAVNVAVQACNYAVTRNTGVTYNSVITTVPGGSTYSSLSSADDGYTNYVSLAGTSFKYKGQSVTQFYATSNGTMSFSGTQSTHTGYGDLTSSTAGKDLMLAPYWTDFVIKGNLLANKDASMRYKINGTLGSGTADIIIEWAEMEGYQFGNPNMNFQVVLHENGNTIEYNYGNMLKFDGAANSTGTFATVCAIGLNGTTPATADLSQRLILQNANSTNFGTTSVNSLLQTPACYSQLVFTPAAAYSGGSAPATVPANNELAGAINLTVNNAPCTSNCGNSYYSLGATASTGTTLCSATTPGTADDDVWFTFTPSSSTANHKIVVTPTLAYDAVLQLIDVTSNTVVQCVNSATAGLLETISSVTLDQTHQYALRVYDAGTGAAGGGEFAVCVSEIIAPPTNDEPTGATALTIGSSCSGISSEYPATLAATASASITACSALTPGTPDDDVWYKFTTSSATGLTYTMTATGVSTYNAVLQLFSGTPGSLTNVDCVNASGNGSSETITSSTLTAGTTYYLRVYHSGIGYATGNFSICVFATPPACITSPTAPTNSSSICLSASATTLSWASVSNATKYDVYLDNTGGSSTVAVATNQTTTSYTTPTALSAGTYTWRVVPKNDYGSATSCTNFTFTVNPTSVAGTVSADQAICTGNSPSDITLSGYTGTIQWQVSSDNTTFANISGATAATLTSAQMSTLSATRYYRAVVTSGACTAANSSAVTVTVNPLPTALVLTGSLACAGATGTITSSTSVIGVSYQLYDSTNATVGSPISGIGSGLSWSSVAIANGYYAKATNTSTTCVSANSNPVNVGTVTTKTWTATSGSGNWSDDNNWSCGTQPTATDVIVISSGSPVLDTNFTVGATGSLTISGTGTFTIGASSTLTIVGATNFGGKAVTIKSNSGGNGAIGQVTGTNLTGATNVTVERYIPAKRSWRAITAPLSTTTSIYANWQENGTGNTVNGFEIWNPAGGTGITTGGVSSSLLSYSSTNNNWTGITDTQAPSTMMDGTKNRPFMAFVTGPYAVNHISSGAEETTLRATGTLLTGDQSYPTVAGKYAFIGNPYASPLDLTAVFNTAANATSYGGTVWVWDANVLGTNNVGTYNLFDFAATNYTNLTNNGNITGAQIQSGQAFFVKSAADATFTIKETHKGSVFTNAVFRTATPELLRVGLYKQVNNEWAGRDGAMTVILADANANQAPNKMANGSENIVFTKNGGNFASNHHLPLVATDVLNVKVWNTTAGTNYKLKINTEQFATTNLDATLEDLFTNARTPLALDGTAVEYPFTVTTEALSTGDRFRIVFQTAALSTNNPKANGFSIVPNPVTGDAFQVNLGTLATGTYTYSICNAIGQEVEKGSINNAAQNTNYTVKFREAAATGIYIMKIKGSDNSVFTAKIIKK